MLITSRGRLGSFFLFILDLGLLGRALSHQIFHAELLLGFLDGLLDLV